jgi:hypothetical protein
MSYILEAGMSINFYLRLSTDLLSHSSVVQDAALHLFLLRFKQFWYHCTAGSTGSQGGRREQIGGRDKVEGRTEAIIYTGLFEWGKYGGLTSRDQSPLRSSSSFVM